MTRSRCRWGEQAGEMYGQNYRQKYRSFPSSQPKNNARIEFRCTKSDKLKWELAAQELGIELSTFIKRRLNRYKMPLPISKNSTLLYQELGEINQLLQEAIIDLNDVELNNIKQAIAKVSELQLKTIQGDNDWED